VRQAHRSFFHFQANASMRKFLDGLYRLSGALAALSLVCIMLIVLGQVLLNILDYLAVTFFNTSFGLLIPSYSLFSGYALGFSTFLALGLGFRRAAHIRVTLLETRMPAAGRRVSLTLIALIGAMISGMFVVSLAELVMQSYEWGDRASGLVRVPLWIPQSALLFGSLVFFIAALDTLADMLRTGKSSAFDAHEETL
jgi:TRAP-type C4-dicarboxylate transport system permease small subunit